MFQTLVALLLLLPSSQPQRPVRVVMDTDLGQIEIEIDAANAPATAANFLKYVDAGLYDGGRFHRTVRPDNQREKPVKIAVIQGLRTLPGALSSSRPFHSSGRARQGSRTGTVRSRWHETGRTPRRTNSSFASAISLSSILAASGTRMVRASPRSAVWFGAWMSSAASRNRPQKGKRCSLRSQSSASADQTPRSDRISYSCFLEDSPAWA